VGTRPDPDIRASSLRQTITLPQAVALYAGAVVGAGVLIAPGVAASTAGPASLIAWAIDGLLGIPLALTIAALAARYPDAGGVAAYTSRAFGAPAGAAVGWLYFCAAAVGQTLVPLTGAHYLAVALGWGHSATVAVAAGILAVSVAINLAGLKLGARLQLVLAATLAALLVAATIAAVPDFTMRSLTPFAPDGWSAVGRACVVLFFAFFGWEAIAHLSAEFRNPERDVPLATLLTAGLVTALYIGIAFAVVATHTYGDQARDRTAVAHLLGNAIGLGAERVAAVAALIITLATNNAFVAATSRLGYALGRDGAFPRSLGRIDPRGIPTRAIAFVAAIAGGGLVLAEVRHLGAEDFLIVPNASVIVVYIVAMAAGVRLLHGRARLSATAAALSCAAVLPFIGVALAVPAAVAASALLYRWRFGPGTETEH
jgi:amino acid efflux transporter